ncbi:MAG: hypothetical protein ACJ74W_16045 [Pyrinomonadaceae bacterium]
MPHRKLVLHTRVLGTALAVALVLGPVALLANNLKATLAAAPAAPGQNQLVGRLTTKGNNPITVNGSRAKSGESIFSGQQLQTPAGVGATVQLGSLGRLDIAPNTNLTLTFASDQINVNVASGCVILTTNRGVTGTVTAQGTTQHTDATRDSTIDICTGPAGAAPLIGQGAAAAAGAGAGSVGAAVGTAGAAAGVGIGGGASATTVSIIGVAGLAAVVTTAAVVHPCRRGPNPSPGVPRGGNDECRD